MDQMTSLLERLRPRIEHLGGGGHDGEDLYGDVQLACVEKYERYDWSHPKIEGRIIRIANNRLITRRRREQVRKHTCLPAEDCPALAFDESTAVGSEKDKRAPYQALVNSLPDHYREVIHQHLTKGNPLVAIARQMGLPSATIRTRFRRALERLKQHPLVEELNAPGEPQF